MVASGDIAVPTFNAVIAAHARQRPEAIALRFGDQAWSFAAVNARANGVAHRLIADGVAPGDRVAWLGRNDDAMPILSLGVMAAGAIMVPINWRLSAREIGFILADSGAKLLFVADDFAAAVGDSGLPTLSDALVFDEAWLAAMPPTPTEVTLDPGDTALLIYTSGTTGRPKGVMLSHYSINGTSAAREAEGMPWDTWTADDVTIVPIPLAHVGGFNMMGRALYFGGEVIIQPLFDPGEVLDAIEHQRVSKIGLVPTAMKMLIDHPRARRIDYSRIETMIYGAAPITLDLLREALEVFGCDFAQAYGMTETFATVVALPPADHDVAGNQRMRSAGTPFPGSEVRIVDPDGKVLPTGETGEVSVRSIAMMNGYWNMPEETARVLDADGWYRTGDAGYLDADGYLFIKDRLKDMICSGAENIYPAEVENALADHPAIGEVAVIGVPDALWGEAVKALVVPEQGHEVDPAEVARWARGRIAGYKLPKTIDVVDALPRNASGKVDKLALRRAYADGAATAPAS